ncbi:hypothetical protein, partial [Gemmatimonas sp.]|uniref:hypothetical protein n=1 Tax=Gemmatimonas sp. TaxID=1962908 RepID=UPI0037BF36B4
MLLTTSVLRQACKVRDADTVAASAATGILLNAPPGATCSAICSVSARSAPGERADSSTTVLLGDGIAAKS